MNILPAIPWQNRTEDQWAANEAIRVMYAAVQLPAPRIAWCPSPATMHRASRMLRQVQAGTSYNMVQALVPFDPNTIEREARVSLLAALIDPTVSTQSGALVISMLERVFGGRDAFNPVIADMRYLLPDYFKEKTAPGTFAPAMFGEQAMYPGLYSGLSRPALHALQTQTVCIMPFVKICWVCKPPKFVHTNEKGLLHNANGPAAEWTDGFAIYIDRTPKEELEANPVPQLEAGDASNS